MLFFAEYFTESVSICAKMLSDYVVFNAFDTHNVSGDGLLKSQRFTLYNNRVYFHSCYRMSRNCHFVALSV